MYLICKIHPAYLVNISNTISQNHTCNLDRKAPIFDFPNDLNSKILLQKMVAGYRQSCMAMLMNYATQCDRVDFCVDSKRKINIKYFLIPAYNNNLSQVCRSASLQSAFVAHRSTVHKLAVFDGHARSKFTSESPLPHREQTPVFCALSKCGDIELPILQKKDGSFVKINTNFRLIIKVSPFVATTFALCILFRLSSLALVLGWLPFQNGDCWKETCSFDGIPR